jgi:CubicO group peptidase (beta-lactamase class C family)
MAPHDDLLNDCRDQIRQILQHAGIAQASIYVEKVGRFAQERTFYIDDEEEPPSGTRSEDTPVYGIGSHTKLLTVLLLSIVVDKLSYLQDEKYRKYRILREIYSNPWETPFTELFNYFSNKKISTLPRNPSLRHVALHLNSLSPMNHVLLALDGTSIISKESFLRVGPRLAERQHKRSEEAYNAYSNGNFAFIGYLIEAIAQESLAIVMQEFLLKPLGMNHTYMDASDSGNASIAHPFVVSADGKRHLVDRLLYPKDSVVNSALGAHSRTSDFAILLRNIQACINGDESQFSKDFAMSLLKPEGILSEETEDRMSLFGICTTLDTSTAGCRSYNRLISPANICSTYSLGCKRGKKKVQVYYIAGATKGYTCSSYLVPKHKFFVIVFTNTTGFTDASDHISRLLLQKHFNLRLPSRVPALLRFNKTVDVVDMTSHAAAEGLALLERLAGEDAEKGMPNLRPFQLEGIYHNEVTEQTIIIEGEKARIVGTADISPNRLPRPIGFIWNGNLSIRLQPLQIVDFTIDRYDPCGWKDLNFSLSIGKDANNNNRVVCLSRQSSLDEFKWTNQSSLLP